MLNALKYCCSMEDEVEIFIAGAKRISKLKGISQEAIANGTKGVAGLKGSQGTISSYFVGRTRPKPAVMAAIAKVLETPYKEIIQTGRHEIAKGNNPSLTEEEVRKIVREEHMATHSNVKSLEEKKNARHHSIIDEFQNHELATEINSDMVEIEKLDPDELEEIRDSIKAKLKKLRKKKRIEENNKTGTGES